MTYFIRGLSYKDFAPLFALGEAALAEIGARRMTADAKPGYPCRVSLADAEPGEDVILVSYEHQPAPASPYRASGPIYVRKNAPVFAADNQLPPILLARLLSVRAYDRDDLMADAEVVEGAQVEGLIRHFLAKPDVSYLHVHFAKRGCFACRVDRR